MTTSQGRNEILTKLTALLAAVVLFVLANQYFVRERLEDVHQETKLLIADQTGLLSTIAETTARNGADAITERIIRDCSLTERTTFDDLLGKLNSGLSRQQLIELERLFGRCGNFYAERKAVMVARFEREIEIYELLVTQLSAVSESDVSEQYAVANWRELMELERKQSELFSELVRTQDSIISALLDGKTAQSQEIKTILTDAQQIQGSLLVAAQQAAVVREGLGDL
jgi:hypothetical protein